MTDPQGAAVPDDGRLAVAAVGFDLGETLYHYARVPLSWIELGRPTLDRVALACGIDRTKAEVAAAHIGMVDYSGYLRGRIETVTAEDVITDLLTRLGGRTARRVEAAVDGVFTFCRTGVEAYPDAVETLAALKQAGFTVGALTNVPFGMPRRTISKDLVRTGLARYLDGYITSVDVGLRKPHRAAFEWLAATLGVDRHELAYVGNLPTDVTGAKACGCVPIFLDRTNSGVDYGQAATVHNLNEVPALVAPLTDR